MAATLGHAGENDSQRVRDREVLRGKRHKPYGVRRDECPLIHDPPTDSADMFRKGLAFLITGETFGLFHSAIRKGTQFKRGSLEALRFRSKRTKVELFGVSSLL